MTHPSNGAVTDSAREPALWLCRTSSTPRLWLVLLWARMEGDPPGLFGDFGGRRAQVPGRPTPLI